MKLHWIIIYSFISIQINAQITGTVTTSNNEALPFATIYVEGTTTGTTSNLEGQYSLRLTQGTYKLIFQYIGYSSQFRTIIIEEGESHQLDIQLFPESVQLEEVVVSADAEDPAYRVIREAIKKRQFYYEQVKSYKAKAYVKGLIKMFDAPQSFLGIDIGNMQGILDTNRQGILYLSESESIVYFKQPEQYKEEMISSIVSGDDQGFSFNQATAVDFNFYKKTERFGRKLISPIANTALQFYTYKLHGVTLDQEGRLVNKIQVIPKRETDPVYFGFIYITEDLWNLQQLDLHFTSKSVNQNFFDTIGIKQVHVPISDSGEWHIFSQIIDFTASIFAFRFGGSFTYIFSDYDINPVLRENLFSGEIMKVEEGANKRDSSYWQDMRPVPLTWEESTDYIRKDSLQNLWESKEYLDSIDRKDNRFKLINLLFGYQYNQSYKHRSFAYNSPISSFQFNPVQGALLSMNLAYRQEYDEEMKYYSIRTQIQYGFSDRIFRPVIEFEWIPENIFDSFFEFRLGRSASQINTRDPVWVNLNSWTSLFGKNNLLKLYDKRFIAAKYERELWNGINLGFGFDYEARRPLENQTNYSFINRNKEYEANKPAHAYFSNQNLEKHEAFIIHLQLDIHFKQEYISYPKQRFRLGSKYPKLRISYQKALSAFGSRSQFDKLKLSVYDRRIEMGRLGFLAFQAEAGWMIHKENLSFIDYFHFLGNELHVTGIANLRNGFLKLPNYAYSTNESYASLILEQHFEGLIMDRVPLLKHLSWVSVMRIRYLYQNDNKRYLELAFGIENISIGPLSLFGIDYVWSLDNGNLLDHGPVISFGRAISKLLD